MSNGSRQPGRPIPRPSIAEMVANVLRERIVSGELVDGDSLPTQDVLLQELNVSRQSLRESLRILENEGLLSIRRGNVGGAQVHVPDAGHATYLLGLVLQLEQVPTTDLATAIRHLEPLCVAECARREDRHETVVPILTERIERAVAEVDHPERFTEESRGFHADVVRLTGNRSLELVVGVLTELWSSQEEQWAHQAVGANHYPTGGERLTSVEDHKRTVDLIAAGDVVQAGRFFEHHVAATQAVVLDSTGQRQITVTTVRDGRTYR